MTHPEVPGWTLLSIGNYYNNVTAGYFVNKKAALLTDKIGFGVSNNKLKVLR